MAVWSAVDVRMHFMDAVCKKALHVHRRQCMRRCLQKHEGDIDWDYTRLLWIPSLYVHAMLSAAPSAKQFILLVFLQQAQKDPNQSQALYTCFIIAAVLLSFLHNPLGGTQHVSELVLTDLHPVRHVEESHLVWNQRYLRE